MSGLLLITGIGITSLILITPFDYDFTLWIHDHMHPSFSSFMARSVFEGDMIGGGDFGIFIYIAAFILFLITIKKRSSRETLINVYAKYLLFTGITIGIGIVHNLKNVMGRARPGDILGSGKPFSPWYVFGPYLPFRDHFSGSFPSGHTATMLCLIAIAYVVYNHNGSGKWKAWGIVLFLSGFF
ncbi:MAG: phosphatase PAP2 family protein, partial [Oligoflexales bacterium]|nr:phosphatase PAP2 family protein [Oligoflexales bacterium]